LNAIRVKLGMLAAGFALVEALARIAAPMPPAREPLPVPPGYTYAYRYKGADHLLNRDGERRPDGALAPKSGRRIAAIGDSYTFGFGVALADTWPAQLAALTGSEVVNYGRGGATSRTVLTEARIALRDDPDVLVYAVCVNDADPADLFLPGGQRWRFSRAGVLRAFARATALTIPETVERYGDFDRFEHDVRTMRAAADRAGTRFVVAVFDNLGFVETVDRYEASIRRAGVEPVPFRLPAGSWIVAPDEQHPNAAAHRLFAEAVARSL
jgi:lysophospholipase L1-like esterase